LVTISCRLITPGVGFSDRIDADNRSLPRPPGDRWSFGNLVIFNSLTHVGMVNDRDSVYRSQTSKGTNFSEWT
jgi:hypothetical protein